jgi:hypothetical protein
MKKLTIYLMTAMMLITIPMQIRANAETEPVKTASTKTVESEQARVLVSRLDEINSMDKSNMKSAEKKQLRKEVKSIKNELKTLGDGVYISVGAIIIILLLLILLL